MSEGLASVTVDVRGLNCPIPLLKTRKAMAVAAAITQSPTVTINKGMGTTPRSSPT